MGATTDAGLLDRVGTPAALGVAAALLLTVLTAIGIGVARDRPELWKLLGIVWVAFFAMAGAAPLGARAGSESGVRRMVWGYGLASGAMVTSAAVFLLPSAIDHHPEFGGFGVAAGLLIGFGTHSVGHRLTHTEPLDHTAIALSAHALSAGVVIGIVYGNVPDLGALLGLAIVSHKGPAGYAAARRLAGSGKSVAVLLVPASGVGITALLAALVRLPPDPVVNGLVFGFATGVFLHVGMDFLPECEVGGEIHSLSADAGETHEHLDEMRLHAVGATLLGGVVVFLAWFLLA